MLQISRARSGYNVVNCRWREQVATTRCRSSSQESKLLTLTNLGTNFGTMDSVFICDAIRTPFGRYGGALSSIRTDDLAALPIKALMERSPKADWGALDDVLYGCANQAVEDNRNVARMALLLAGLPKEVPGATGNRLCGSSMESVSVAARAINSGQAAFLIAGGVESMSRAPF